jgi:branched-chain amino acid transport system ATP-binding protein
MMLDEPSLGLAPMLVDTIFTIIEQINAEGIAVLLVEQNAHRALEISHRAYVLETGSVVMEGPSGTLLNSTVIQKAYLGV